MVCVLRKQIADCIRQSSALYNDYILNDTGKTVQEYCKDLETTNLWGGELEIDIVSMSYKMIVWVVRVDHPTSHISFAKFPLKKQSFDECCHIIYSGDHYEPLYSFDESNPSKKVTIFHCKDENVKHKILEFLTKKFSSK